MKWIFGGKSLNSLKVIQINYYLLGSRHFFRFLLISLEYNRQYLEIIMWRKNNFVSLMSIITATAKNLRNLSTF